MKFFLLLRIEKKNYVNLSQNCAATKSMYNFLLALYGDIQHNTDKIDKMWPHIGMEKEEKKRFSRICNFLFSKETYKGMQTIDKMWRYTFELRKRRNFFARQYNTTWALSCLCFIFLERSNVSVQSYHLFL